LVRTHPHSARRSSTRAKPVRRGVVRERDRQHREVAQADIGYVPQIAQDARATDGGSDGHAFFQRKTALRGVGIQGHEERDLDDRRGREDLVGSLREQRVA
jgi:hypothetical protein